jgi:dTMP kinase
LERLGPGFADRVRQGFVAQAASDPEHWVVVDGTLPINEVTTRILERVRARLGTPG